MGEKKHGITLLYLMAYFALLKNVSWLGLTIPAPMSTSGLTTAFDGMASSLARLEAKSHRSLNESLVSSARCDIALMSADSIYRQTIHRAEKQLAAKRNSISSASRGNKKSWSLARLCNSTFAQPRFKWCLS